MTPENRMLLRHARTYALRTLMGYPHQPIADPVVFGGVGLTAKEALGWIEDAAKTVGRDFVMVHHDPIDALTVRDITIAVRQSDRVDLMSAAIPYAASESAPLQLLASGLAWRIGARNVLTSHRLPPPRRISQGIAIAKRRWDEAVEVASRVISSGDMVAAYCGPVHGAACADRPSRGAA